MKIAQYCDYIGPARGSMGTERVVESITKGLTLLGHEVVMYINPASDEAKMPAPVVKEIPKDCDIVHSHGEHSVLLNKLNIPWISTVHGGGSDPVGYPWQGNERYVCVSEFIRKMYNNRFFVYNCVNPDDFIFSEKKDDYYAWIAGTDWGEGKGIFTTIQAAKKMNVKLKIAGTGKNKNMIDQIKSLCNNKIEYVGEKNGVEKVEFLSKAKAVILYSRLPDACPVSVLESLMSGTPVIGSSNGSLPELIVNNKTGIVCKNDNEICKAMVLVDKIKSKDCREYALNNFSNTIIAEKYVKIYQHFIEKRN